ncbi:SRPBCC domain-containing protein [Actibacterium sp. 188UL27-1]|uniref:SRPBCC domain-containing protein n=1 Tax=Actibacterium sp. 188UL27-1 TaxID=2786961 RepID=UPI00195BFEA8|nr:SRPBCC domain-containing protein [Actibacterium sp. 188UL27-1]MBM7068301.1 SRPBCC domain-containing protein [Actibacterium sp. 188UL27-1]
MEDFDTTPTAPIHKTITVPLPPDHAFELFTAGINKWWPGDTHSLSARDGRAPRQLDVDPHQGGRIWETTHDGKRHAWARITDWQPGRRFAFNWHVGQEEEDATHVVVAFSQTKTGTRVDLTHGGFDGVTDGATMMASYQTGWDHVLTACYGTACQGVVTA